jgi:hypothetical protein
VKQFTARWGLPSTVVQAARAAGGDGDRASALGFVVQHLTASPNVLAVETAEAALSDISYGQDRALLLRAPALGICPDSRCRHPNLQLRQRCENGCTHEALDQMTYGAPAAAGAHTCIPSLQGVMTTRAG